MKKDIVLRMSLPEYSGTADDAIFLLNYLNEAVQIHFLEDIAYFNYVHDDSYTRRVYFDDKNFVNGILKLLSYLEDFTPVTYYAKELLEVQKRRVRNNALYRCLILSQKSLEYELIIAQLFGGKENGDITRVRGVLLRLKLLRLTGIKGIRISLSKLVGWSR